MSMKKTDLYKNLAKKVDGRMKSAPVPQRFGPGAVAVAEKRDKDARDPATRLVAVSCRLPADLVNRLRERAAGEEGGINVVIAQAVERWLESAAARQAQ